MYQICKDVIMSGRFELSAMIRKIDTLWLQSQLTDKQKTELEALAREYADPVMSINVIQRLDDLDARVKILEAGGAAPQPEGQYPEYKEGMSARNGEIYLWKGKAYKCVLPEHVDVCVWSPDAYPAYWQAL